MMPDFQGRPCVGICESFNKPCTKPEFYRKLANEYGAKPEKRTGKMNVSGRIAPWEVWTLNVQGANRPKLIERIRQETEDIQLVDLQLPVFPCVFCDVTICGYCGKPHSEDLIENCRQEQQRKKL